jgi:hypothetical protein
MDQGKGYCFFAPSSSVTNMSIDVDFGELQLLETKIIKE